MLLYFAVSCGDLIADLLHIIVTVWLEVSANLVTKHYNDKKKKTFFLKIYDAI